jgi:3-hydroxyisobutyrate dehydrogenase-like beta-hydroxyacid dehydrogenase
MGNVGDGQVTKACNQIVQVVAIQGIAEAMLYAEVNDVDLNKVVEALMSGFAGSKMLGLMGPKMAARDFAAGIEARLHHKDFGLVADAAAKQHLPMPATVLVHQQLSKLMEAGWGKMDTCNLLRVLETQLHHTSA